MKPIHIGIIASSVQSSSPIIYLQDDFIGSDGVNLTAHTMNVGSGWTKSLDGLSCAVLWDCLLNGNMAQFLGGTSFGIYWAEASHANVVASVDMIIPNSSNYSSGLVFRYSSCSNYWVVLVERDGGGTPYMAIFNEVSGSLSSALATVNLTGATNSTVNIKVTCSGNSIVALAGTGETCNYSSSFNNTETKFGILTYTDGSYTRGLFDNFLVTN